MFRLSWPTFSSFHPRNLLQQQAEKRFIFRYDFFSFSRRLVEDLPFLLSLYYFILLSAYINEVIYRFRSRVTTRFIIVRI